VAEDTHPRERVVRVHNAKVAAGFGSFLLFVMQFFAGRWWQRSNMPTWLPDTSPTSPPAAPRCKD
jgi:hypothetical protein